MSTDFKYIAIFFALFFTDIVWTLYIRWASEGKAFRAAFSSVLIYIIGAISITAFFKDPWILLPASLGCFLGTYITIVVVKRKENPEPFFGKRIRELVDLFKKI